MKRVFLLGLPLLAAVTLVAFLQQPRQQAAAPILPPHPPQRAVAVTFDDLPAVAVPPGLGCDAEALLAFTDRLLASVVAHDVPAIGFVNEGKLCEEKRAALMPAALTRWLEAGADLGNHTYAHPSLYATPLDDFQAEIVRGEAVTQRLLAERGARLRYFRHPFLNTGPDLATKEAFEAFLAGRGYTIAPVTLDNDEWIYARAYRQALVRKDSAAMKRIGGAYLDYMDEVFAHFEGFSVELLGREMKHVLLLHANSLNADYFGALAGRIAARGYAFISLDEALEDPAYALRDEYTGQRGVSWLERWAFTQGRTPDPQPAAPAWVREASRGN